MVKNMEEELETDKKEEFLKEYRTLCRKYGYDFAIPAPQVVKIVFPQDQEIKFDDITPNDNK